MHAMARCGFALPKERSSKVFWGKQITLPLNDKGALFLSYFGIVGGKSEHKLIKFFVKTLQPDDIFYDIGASYGFYTWLAQEFVSQGEIHAFEPLAFAFKCLRKNTERSPRMFLNNVAIADREGELDFYESLALSGISTSVVEVAKMSPKLYKKTTVSAITLERYAGRHKLPTVIKIDAEGAEKEIVEGGRNIFARSRPVIAMEIYVSKGGWQDRSLKAVRFLQKLGYAVYAISGDGDIARTDIANLLRAKHEINDAVDNIVLKVPKK
jgi:FkbM family methyltransferase